MEVMHERVAGLDVHKNTVVACARLMGRRNATRTCREFATTTDGLLALLAWLRECECTHVAMEATGVYWTPVWKILNDGDFELIVANAAHIKQVPGRKSDVNDATWIADLLACGLIRASFVPEEDIQELRSLMRTRKQLGREQTRHTQRIQKTLHEANIKLDSVLSDIMGASGRRIVEAIIGGVDNPSELAALARRGIKATPAELRDALHGRVRDNHRFLLRVHLNQWDGLEAAIQRIDQQVNDRIERMDGPVDVATADAATADAATAGEGTAGAATAGAASAAEGTAGAATADAASTGEGADAGAGRFRSLIDLLRTIPGVGVLSATAILAEIGRDMTRFASAGHLVSWAGLCPGLNESAGRKKSSRLRKGDPWLKTMLVQCAWAAKRSKKSYYAAQFHRLTSRRGPQKAICAVAASILTAIYHMVRNGSPHRDLGADYFDRRKPLAKVKRLVGELSKLGYTATLQPIADAA